MSRPGQVKKARILELGVPLFLIGIAAAFLWDSRTLPGAGFDRLGPAPVPRLICWCVIILCGVVIGQVYLAHRAAEASTGSTDPDRDAPGPADEDVKPQPVLALLMLGLTGAYVAVLAARISSFALATSVFLLLTIGGLNRFDRKGMLVTLVIALAMGFGCQYLFTEVFVIDLPTGDE